MTNKPMLSVERELVERIAGIYTGGLHRDGVNALHELRALLDEPDEPFNLQGWSIDHSAGRPILMHNKCSVIEAEQAYGLLNLIETAAQRRGDTVERLKQVNNKQWRALIDMRDELDTLRALMEERQFQYKPYDDHYHRESGYYCVGCGDEKGKHVDNTCHVFIALSAEKESVVAEQHAPIADHTQREECKGWGYHENHHEGGGAECGECGGSGNATVAVVMPEPYSLAMFQMISGFESVTPEQFDLVWSACREEVSRLNGLKP